MSSTDKSISENDIQRVCWSKKYLNGGKKALLKHTAPKKDKDPTANKHKTTSESLKWTWIEKQW